MPPSGRNGGMMPQLMPWHEAHLFDLDGTVYLGDTLLLTVPSALRRIRERGILV